MWGTNTRLRYFFALRKDLEFFVGNKVTHVVNCASKQVHNSWESVEVRYLTFPWDDSDAQVNSEVHVDRA